jgi:hypothetical protein
MSRSSWVPDGGERPGVQTLKLALPSRSPLGRALGWVAFPWLFAVAIGALLILNALGYSVSDPGPPLFRLVAIAISIAPATLWITSQWLGKVPGFRWLLDSPQPMARIDAEGIDLTLPRAGTRRLEWDHVAGMLPGRRLQEQARLIGLDGTTLVEVPESLVYATPFWGPTRTMAQVIVETRPDRYSLSDADWRGLPDGFALRGTVRNFDVQEAEGRRVALHSRNVLVLVAVTVGVVVLWFLTQGR